MKRIRTTLAHLSSSVLALSVAVAPLPVLAGAPAEAEAEAPTQEVGGVVGLLRLDGEPGGANEFRELLQTTLYENGYDVKGVSRSGVDAAKKNKCDISEDACLSKIGKYLNKNARTPFNFFILGNIPDDGGTGEIVAYDIDKDTVVRRVTFTRSLSDAILPITLPGTVGRALAEYQVPRAGISEEETAFLAQLDEPDKTPEEIAAEEKRLADAERAGTQQYNASFDAGEQNIDLKKDFDKFCRSGPREDEVSVDMDGEEQIERDLRPVCKRGAFFGYWQPKSYAVMVMTLGSVAAMGAMYGLALGANGEWKKAKDTLEASGLGPNRLTDTTDGYVALAGATSSAAAKTKRFAIIGDALLGTSVLLGGLLTIIVFQERGQAKDFLQTKKELQISDLRVGPLLGAGNYGAAAGFSF